jgi:plasmid maintenance system antidote protein VapI
MRRKTPSEVLKVAIKIDGRPVHRIAKDAGVDHAAVSRFVNGKRGITLLTFDKLASAVNLQVIHRRSA